MSALSFLLTPPPQEKQKFKTSKLGQLNQLKADNVMVITEICRGADI
jgi:hypothetical protein